MPFTVNTITLKGAELLAAATAANPLILDGCDATQTYVDQATAVNVSARPASSYSNTTSVSIIGATDNHVVARAQFEAGTNTGGDVNTIYLYGHSQNDPSNVYVVYVCSSQTAVHLPLTTDVLTIVEILCDMIYTVTSGSVLTASTSVFTTLAEFEMLKERTVTTHKEGDPNSGDQQIIKGQKEFFDDAVFDEQVNFGGEVYILDDTHTKDVYVDGDLIVDGDVTSDGAYIKTLSDNNIPGNIITLSANLVPDSDLTPTPRSLGDSSHCFATVYTRDIDNNGRNILVKGSMVVGAPSADCVIFPTSTATDSVIGTYTYPFKKAYLGTAMIRDESSGSSKATWLGIPKTQTEDGVTTVVKSHSSISFFESSSVARTTICADYDDDEGDDLMFTYIELTHPKGAGTYDSLSIYIDDEEDYKLSMYYSPGLTDWLCDINAVIYANKGIIGTAPSPTSASVVQIPIGGIAFAYLVESSGNTLVTGTIITIPTAGTTLTALEIYGTTTTGVMEFRTGTGSFPNGKYVLLCDSTDRSGTGWSNQRCVLVQRIA